ncbi:hypothetical protein [Natronomonas sp.]|uniref:hypothetical protein n=1 Tax=Natronomonas sp. TaxID=2184060 RepID=UPI00260220DC|nr:hypothetical protein [Natronomonas sp.]
MYWPKPPSLDTEEASEAEAAEATPSQKSTETRDPTSEAAFSYEAAEQRPSIG